MTKMNSLLRPMLGLIGGAMLASVAAAPAYAATAPCPAVKLEGAHITVQTMGAGPDIVLIPGLSTPCAVWDNTAQRLAAAHRLHLVQRRGFGDAAGANEDGPVLAPAMQDIVRYIGDCITGKGQRAPAIIGHSAGGLIGLMIAVQAPDQLNRLMVVDALPFIGTLFAPGATVDMLRPQAAAMADAMRAQPAPTTLPDTDPGEASMVARMSNTPAGRLQVARWAAAAAPAVSAQLFYDLMTTDLRGDITKIQTPVTLVYAQDDAAMPPAAARAVFETPYRPLPNFHARMIERSRHFIMLDQPDAFAEAVDQFLAMRD